MRMSYRELPADNSRSLWSFVFGCGADDGLGLGHDSASGGARRRGSEPAADLRPPRRSARTPRLRAPCGPPAQLGDVPEPHPPERPAISFRPRRSHRPLRRRPGKVYQGLPVGRRGLGHVIRFCSPRISAIWSTSCSAAISISSAFADTFPAWGPALALSSSSRRPKP